RATGVYFWRNFRMNKAKTSLFTLIAMGAAMGACSGGSNGDSGGGGSNASSSSDTTGSSSGSGSGSGSGSSSSSSSGGSLTQELKIIANFKPADNEFPEGLAVTADGKTAYVGFAPTGKVVKVSLLDGQITPFGALPAPPPAGELMLGLILDAQGTL